MTPSEMLESAEFTGETEDGLRVGLVTHREWVRLFCTNDFQRRAEIVRYRANSSRDAERYLADYDGVRLYLK